MKRVVLVALGPLAVLGAFIAAVAATAAVQPDPLATHWDLSGRPDGSSSLPGFLVAVIAAATAAWLVLLAHWRRHGHRKLTAAPPAWAVMWLLLALGAAVLAANAGAADWRQADAVTPPLGLVPMLAGAMGAAIAWRLERGHGVPTDDGRVLHVRLGRASVGLRDDERAVWSARAGSFVLRCAAALAALILGAGALLAGGPQGILLGLLAVVVVGLVLAVSEVEVTVDQRGVCVALGPFGRPRVSLRLSEIAEVERISVDPWQWGGWGYRRVPRR